MSSISAADRSNQTDEIRRLREDYENREAETVKRKNREIRNINQKHEKELDNVENNFSNQVEVLRNKHAELIDDRDRRHSEDVGKIREMYMDSLRKKSTDDNREKETLKETYEGELGKQKEVSQQQRETVERGFRNTMLERDRQVEQHNDDSAVKLQESIKDRADKLNAKHDVEMKAVTEDRDHVRKELTTKMADMKSAFEDADLAKDRLHRSEVERRGAAFENMHRNQELTNNHMMETRDKELHEEREHLHQRTGDALRDQAKKMEGLREQYASEMEARTGATLKRAQSEMSEARNEQILDAITNRRLRDIDHDHLMRSYQEREEDLNHQKDEVTARANDVARERVNKVLARTDKLMSDVNWHNRMDQNISDMRNREALAQQEVMHKDQVQLTNTRAEERVRKVMNTTAQSQKELLHQQELHLDELRKNYGENLQTQREAQLESLKSVYARMDERLREQEATALKKRDQLVENYETQLTDMDNQRKDQLRQLSQSYEARISQREKAVKMEEDSMNMKFEQKFAVQEDTHKKEIERLERRHKEQMQELVNHLSAESNSRKA